MKFVLVVECGFCPLLGQSFWKYAIFFAFSSILNSLAQNTGQQDERWHKSKESRDQAQHFYDMSLWPENCCVFTKTEQKVSIFDIVSQAVSNWFLMGHKLATVRLDIGLVICINYIWPTTTAKRNWRYKSMVRTDEHFRLNFPFVKKKTINYICDKNIHLFSVYIFFFLCVMTR